MNPTLKRVSLFFIVVTVVVLGWRTFGGTIATTEQDGQTPTSDAANGVGTLNGASRTSSVSAPPSRGINQGKSMASGSAPSGQWKEQVFSSNAEFKAQPRFWMLAHSEADKAWLEQYGYPTLEQDAKLSAASIEELRILSMAGDLNARVNLGVRYAQMAMQNGDEKAFLLGMSSLTGSLIEGGPYQAAKTMAFFAELAKNSQSYGELDAVKLKGLQEKLLPNYDLARGLSAAYGDQMAYQLGRDYNDDVRKRFDLPERKVEFTLESALQVVSNFNNTRAVRGIPPIAFTSRPLDPLAFNREGKPITVFYK